MSARSWMFTLCAAMAVVSLSCTSLVYREVYPTLLDGKYDSEFPYKGCSQQLEEISESVRMLNAIAYYRNFVFAPEARITREQLAEPFVHEKAERVVFLNRTSSGSAAIVASSRFSIAMLTCAHIIDFPDTVVTYYAGADRRPTPYVQSCAVKEREEFYIAGVQGMSQLQVLVKDRGADLAVVGRKFVQPLAVENRALTYPLGNAKELEWGAFVYIFGYPSGHRMVTKAIVSSPNRDRRGSFYLDSGHRRGYSGGIVLAVRDGVPNFELVGLVRAAKGNVEYVVTPSREGEGIEADPSLPYRGDLFVERRTDVEFGVAEAISAEALREFVDQHREQLTGEGYVLPWKTIERAE